MRKYFIERGCKIPTLVKAFVLIVGAIVAALAVFSAPTYPARSGNIDSDGINYSDKLWDSTDPYGFKALEYALYYSDLCRTNVVQTYTLTNYVKHTYLAGVVAADEIADAALASALTNYVDTVTAPLPGLNVKAIFDAPSGRWNLYQTR